MLIVPNSKLKPEILFGLSWNKVSNKILPLRVAGEGVSDITLRSRMQLVQKQKLEPLTHKVS